MLDPRQRATRESWSFATRLHNAHKGDQAAFLASGGTTLFPEELELLGDVRGSRLLHVQCNSAQDSLCLARLGARVVGVDFSDEAIRFGRALSEETAIPIELEEAEIVSWLAETERRFDVVFGSYGVVPWHERLAPLFRGVERVLAPGGRFVLLEFHPAVFSIDRELRLRGDDYFAPGPFTEPVSDYVGESAAGLLHGANVATPEGPAAKNELPAYSWEHGFASVLQAVIDAGLVLERVVEWPHANGWRANPALVADGRRWVWPEGAARLPLMFGLVARRRA